MSSRVLRFLILCFWLPVSALAWSTVAVGQDTRPLCTVRGTVEDRVTHQPIARALVETGEDAVLTDSEGHFELHLHQGMAGIHAKRPGYAESPRTSVHLVQITGDMSNVVLSLIPSARISGHVNLSGEDEDDDFRLTPYRRVVVGEHEQWAPAGVPATVDGEGTFRFVGLDAPGSYVICNQPGGAGMAGNQQAFGYPSLCFPGGTDFASVNPLQLHPGEQAQLEINLPRVPLYRVHFTVGNRTARPPSIQILDRGGRMLYFAPWNEARGFAEARIPNGSYYAEARSMGEKAASYGRVDFSVANAPLNLNIVLLPLNPIPVEVHKEFTNASSGGPNNSAGSILMSSNRDDFNVGVSLMLTPAEGVGGFATGGGLRHADGGGPESFQLDAQPGRFRVSVQAIQGYVSSITSGGVDLMREPLVIGPGNSSAPIEVTLRDDGGEIDCTTRSDTTSQPATGFAQNTSTYAIPQFATATRIYRAFGSGLGACHFSNLPPGPYRWWRSTRCANSTWMTRARWHESARKDRS